MAACEAEGVDIVWLPGVEEVYPPGFDTLVQRRSGGGATGGRGAPRPLRRRGHGRGHPLRAGGCRARLLRPEGCAAGHGHPAHGRRPGTADAGRPLPHRPRAGRPGAVVAQRAPLAGGAAGRARAPPGAHGRPTGLAGGRARGRRAARAHGGDAGHGAAGTGRVRLLRRRPDPARARHGSTVPRSSPWRSSSAPRGSSTTSRSEWRTRTDAHRCRPGPRGLGSPGGGLGAGRGVDRARRRGRSGPAGLRGDAPGRLPLLALHDGWLTVR